MPRNEFFFAWQVQIADVFIATDIQHANDRWPVTHGAGLIGIGAKLVLFGRAVAAFQKQEFGAHQVHSLSALFDREGGLFGKVDIGADDDLMAIGRGGGLGAGFGRAGGVGFLIRDPCAGGCQISLGRVQMQPSALPSMIAA